MFRNYLTYQFAEGYDRDCMALEGLEASVRNELTRCSHALVVHFDRALRAEIPAERAKALFTALTYLQDSVTILGRVGVTDDAILGRARILEGRLEKLFLDSAGENGQLRMLG